MLKNWQEFYDLEQLVWQAKDRLCTGSGEPGTHYYLINRLRQLGVFANGREESIAQGERILQEFEMVQNLHHLNS